MAGRHAVWDSDVIVRVVMHTDLIARLHSRWACDGDSLDWVGVAERAAPALVGLAFEQPAVDAPAIRCGGWSERASEEESGDESEEKRGELVGASKSSSQQLVLESRSGEGRRQADRE